MLNSGLVLTALSFVAAWGNIAMHFPKIKANRARLRPRREQAIMIAALLLAGAGFFLQPGIVGFILGGLAVIPAGLFLLGTNKSGLAYQPPAVAVGAIAPDFVALDGELNEFRLWARRGAPILLKFYRGVWCPYCVGELDELNRVAGDFAALGVVLVAVSSDRPDELRQFKRGRDWAIALLADPALAIHRLYNVQQRNFTPKRGPFRDLAIPTTILLDKAGRVLFLEQTSDFRVRPHAEAILAKTRALLSNGASDDLATPSCEACEVSAALP